MIRSRRPIKLAAVFAVTAALALAACSSKGSSGGSVTSSSGAFGSVPAASGTPAAGTVTWAEAPGTAPTYIFPVVPGADLTVTTVNSFQFELWRPLYWYTNGTAPTETPSMSLASQPKYSTGTRPSPSR